MHYVIKKNIGIYDIECYTIGLVYRVHAVLLQIRMHLKFML